MKVYVNGDLIESNVPSDTSPEVIVAHMKELFGDDAVIEIFRDADELISAAAVEHDKLLRSLTGNASDAEEKSWPLKIMDAKSVLAGTATDTQLAAMAGEADEVGETVEATAGKILFNAAFGRQAMYRAAGIKRSTVKAIKAASSPAEAEAAFEAGKARAHKLAAEFTAFKLIVLASAEIMRSGDASKMTADHKPLVEALVDATGIAEVDADLRDKAFAMLQ